MKSSAPYRDLLLADLALVLEIAAARDVAFALQRFWEKREEGVSILTELREVARLTDEDVARLEEEAAKLVEEAGGDPRLALGARGGIDRSIHLELSRVGGAVARDVVEAGTGVRAPLRAVAEDRYLGFQEIGRGGMGVVYLALDTELNRRVAMKVVRLGRSSPETNDPLDMTPPGSDTPASGAFRTLAARFLQEAWVTGGLEHPGVVPVYELGRTPKGVPYYTMRFVKGERTLERAIDEAETLEDRLALLEPFLKVCDTIAYAHSRGVVHRDLKPANIVLGEFGEVVVIDWGLARVAERPDLSQTTWKDRIEEIRETEDLKTLAGGLGTPGYMAPEAVLESPDDVDEKSDVYSLGAILYRALTGRLPYEFASFPELVSKLMEEDPTPPHEVVPTIPEDLSRLCLRALSRTRAERPRSVRELSGAIRSWQKESAVDREVEALLSEARTAWRGAEGLTGEALLAQIDRVLAHTRRARELRPEEPEAKALAGEVTVARARALAEQQSAVRRSVLRRAAVFVLVLALAAAGVVGWLLDSKRREAVAAEKRATQLRDEAERERDRAEVERTAKEKALADVLRLADVRRVRDLAAEVEARWPLHPDRAEDYAGWLRRAEEVIGNRGDHERALAVLRTRSLPRTEEDLAQSRWRLADPADAWQHEEFTNIVAGIENLASGDDALLQTMRDRLRFVREIEARLTGEDRDLWRKAIAAISDVRESPAYAGLEIEPILGLVPLGKDPESGLFEFAHLGSGSLPRRDPDTGKLLYKADSAIVLVLIPGGTFQMGAQSDDRAAPNYDGMASSAESPVHDVTLRPYLIAKTECTQAQWATLTGGERPSFFDESRGGSDRHPVEQLSFEDAAPVLAMHRLRLPSEAEWEYAARAGSDSRYCFGDDDDLLSEYAWYKKNSDLRTHEAGTRRSNAWGIFDLHGNVWEWCEDCFHSNYNGAPDDGRVWVDGGSSFRVLRGGSWGSDARYCRSAFRSRLDPGDRPSLLGFRPAASVP